MDKALLVRKELHAMRKTGYRVRKVLLSVLHERVKKDFQLRLQTREIVRLGIFQTWATRYHVSLTYVLRTLLDFWTEKTSKRRRPGKRIPLLPVSVPALASRGSEEILRVAIVTGFPGEENLAQWQTAARLRVLGLSETRGRAKSLFDAEDPEQSCSIWMTRLERRRKLLDKAEAESWRKQRRWRGNPWL
jgi:hypothetical protein